MIFRSELKRSWRTPGFYISLIIGCAITITHWIQYIVPYVKLINTRPDYDKSMIVYPANTFNNWIGGTDTIYSKLFFLILPLLVVLPFSISFYQDCKSGYINFICVRTSQKSYFKAKFLSVFLSGGAVTVLPLILNFVLSAVIMPCLPVEEAAGASYVLPKSSLSYLFFEQPFLFNIVSLLIIFTFSGILATTTLMVTFYSKNIYTPMLFPFILCLVIMSFTDLIQKYEWQHINFLCPVYSSPRLFPMIMVTGVLLIVSCWEFLFKGSRQDVL